MYRIRAYLILFISGLFLVNGFEFIYGQSFKPETRVDSLLVRKWDISQYINRWPTTGEEVLEVMRNSYPHEIDSLVVLGNRENERHQWKKASNIFEIVLSVNPDHIGAHYGRGISRREYGRNTNLLPRQMAWEDADIHFKHVQLLSETYGEIFFEQAILERYRLEYFNAIELSHKQFQVKVPTDHIKKELFLFYDSMLNHVDFNTAEKWLLSRKTIYDVYFLGELYRRKDRTTEADAIFQELLKNTHRFPETPVHLSRVRLLVQQGRHIDAEESYWKAVDAVYTSFDKDILLDDFWPIVNAREYQLLSQRIPKAMLREALQAFWLRRNPLPSMPFNPRFIEHMRRVIEAEKRFYYDGFRHPGYKSLDIGFLPMPEWYHSNRRFNDLGVIYIRYGEPDKKATYVGMPSADTPFSKWVVFPTKISKNLSWLYNEREDEPQRIFHFCVPENAPPTYWTMLLMFDAPEILEVMLDWDHRLFELINVDEDMPSHALTVFQELVRERARDVNEVLQNDRPSIPDEDELLAFYPSVDRFRLTDNHDILELAFAVLAEDVMEGVALGDRILLETGIKIFDGAVEPSYEDTRSVTLSPNNTGGIYKGWYIDQFEIPVQPKNQNITFHAIVPANQRYNGYRFVEPAPSAERDKLSCSTLKLAFDISKVVETKFQNRRSLDIVPNPTGRFDKKDPIYIYYEIYNLSFDQNAQTQYSVNFTLRELDRDGNVFDRITGIFSDGQPYRVTVESELSGTTGIVTDFISFDMSRARTGQYDLTLEIRDLISNEKTITSRRIELY